jgi:hypothetical protein
MAGSYYEFLSFMRWCGWDETRRPARSETNRRASDERQAPRNVCMHAEAPFHIKMKFELSTQDSPTVVEAAKEQLRFDRLFFVLQSNDG